MPSRSSSRVSSDRLPPMSKSLLFRLFGFGKIPQELQREFLGEDLLLFDEGVSHSTHYRKYRSPRMGATGRKGALAGASRAHAHRERPGPAA